MPGRRSPRTRPRTAAWLLAGALAAPSAAADGGGHLRLGLLPFLSPQRLVSVHRPLAEHLGTCLGATVRMVSAPGFRAFLERALAGRYDLYATAPHLAVLAEDRGRGTALARYARELDGVLVVRTGSGLEDLGDLAGRRIALPDPLAAVSALGEALLAARGLRPGAGYEAVHVPSHSSVLRTVLDGAAAAGIIGAAVLVRAGPERRRRLRVLARTEPMPAITFVAAARLPDALRRRARECLLGFGDTAPGRAYFAATGWIDLVAVTRRDRDRARRLLAAAPAW